jgi:hypothetical protein
MTRCLLFKQLLETLQVVNVDVGYRPVGEIDVAPVDQVIAPPAQPFVSAVLSLGVVGQTSRLMKCLCLSEFNRRRRGQAIEAL